MTQIVLNDDQVRSVRDATDVEVRDLHGHLLGYLSRPAGVAEISEATRRLESNGPWCSTKQVFDHLDSLEAK